MGPEAEIFFFSIKRKIVDFFRPRKRNNELAASTPLHDSQVSECETTSSHQGLQDHSTILNEGTPPFIDCHVDTESAHVPTLDGSLLIGNDTSKPKALDEENHTRSGVLQTKNPQTLFAPLTPHIDMHSNDITHREKTRQAPQATQYHTTDITIPREH